MTFSSVQDPRHLALQLSLSFLLFGLVWVFATDVLLYALVTKPTLRARIETGKGWVFVGVTAVFLYFVAVRTTRKSTHARELTRAVIESIADGVLLLGRDRTIIYANRAALAMLGCSSVADLVGVGAEEFVRRYRISSTEGALLAPEELVSQRVFTEGGRIARREVMHLPGGKQLVFDAIAAPVRYPDESGTDMVVSVIHDVTDSDRLDQLRDQIISAAAHALKTPVAIIQGHAQLMAMGDAPPRLHRSIQKIDAQTHRMDRLVQNLLVLARTRTQTLRLETEPVDLGSLVESTVNQMMPGGTYGREVRVDVDASLCVQADRERLALVVRNLIDEGCRSSRPGDELAVTVRGEGDAAELDVRYHRLPDAELPPADWDELEFGRTVVRTLVALHGGTLDVAVADDIQTERVRLPTLEAA